MNPSDLIKDLGVALDDWLHVYAHEHFDVNTVEASFNRIREAGGVIAYISKLQARIDDFLKLYESTHQAKGGEVDRAVATVGHTMPSAASTPSEQVKNIGAALVKAQQ